MRTHFDIKNKSAYCNHNKILNGNSKNWYYISVIDNPFCDIV